MKILSTALLATLILAGCSSSDSDSVDETDTGGSGGSVIDDGSTNVPGNSDDDTDNQPLTINTENYEQVLKDVIGVLNLGEIDQLREQVAEFDKLLEVSDRTIDSQGEEDQLPEGLMLESQTSTEDYSVEMHYTCNGEGSLMSLYHNTGESEQIHRDVNFDNCLASDTWRNGRYEADRCGRRCEFIQTFTDFSTRQNNTEHSLSGEWTNGYTNETNAVEHDWKDVAFTSTGTTDDMQLSDFNWHREGGERPFHPYRLTGYVQDFEGNSSFVEQTKYSAQLQSDFQFSNASTGDTPVQVSVSLSFSGDYFRWNNEDYPVSELGSPLTIAPTQELGSDVQTVENPPKDTAAQWQTGELTITAQDGSSVSLRPSSDDKTLVDIELNASGEPQTRSWSEGFSIDCPSTIDGCGDDALEF